MSKIIFEIDTDNMTLAEIFLSADKFVSAYVNRASELGNTLSILDKELSDLSHDIETSSLNVVEGYKMYARFKELRRTRRVVKNDLDFSKAMNECGLNMPKNKALTNKGARHYKAKESYRESQVEYLNMDILGKIDWSDVNRVVNSCLPDVEEGIGQLEEKLLKANA